jgi:hypothetical protein
MTALFQETRVSLGDLAHEQGVHFSTVSRWALHGVRGVRLESFVLGGRRQTSREAWDRFVQRTNAEPVTAGGAA